RPLPPRFPYTTLFRSLRRRVRVAHQPGEVVSPFGDGGHRPRGVDDEIGERPLVLRELVDEPARGRQERVEVLGRLAGQVGLALRSEEHTSELQSQSNL